MRLLLAADIGATHARFLLGDPAPQARPESALVLDSQAFADAETLLGHVLAQYRADPAELVAVLALPGPAMPDAMVLTNLPWRVDRNRLLQHFGFAALALHNDLAAAAQALAESDAPDCLELQPGRPRPHARQLLVSVGSGLGTAYWRKTGGEPQIEAAEAGHMSFAPSARWQSQWLAALRQEYERVSWERVLSGPGLAALDGFLRNAPADAADAVAERARHGDRIARAALDDFAQLLGAFVGDLALGGPAPGGVWLGGGVLQRLAALLDTDLVLEAYRGKGRLTQLMSEIPVHRCRDPNLGLRGAWLLARRLAATL